VKKNAIGTAAIFRRVCPLFTHVMGVAYKNLSVKSDVSPMLMSKSGFDLEHGAFCADLKKNDLK